MNTVSRAYATKKIVTVTTSFLTISVSVAREMKRLVLGRGLRNTRYNMPG